MGEQMFEVREYTDPYIFVTCRRTGETYRFRVENDGTVRDNGHASTKGMLVETAITYLAQELEPHKVLRNAVA